MMKSRCPQCGAQLRDDTTCAERLYRMLTSGGIAQARIGEAFAQFALSHPMTYSNEALQVALELVAPQKGDSSDPEDDSDETAMPADRWWRHFARRASCH
jgi:hypothetical protein